MGAAGAVAEPHAVQAVLDANAAAAAPAEEEKKEVKPAELPPRKDGRKRRIIPSVVADGAAKQGAEGETASAAEGAAPEEGDPAGAGPAEGAEGAEAEAAPAVEEATAAREGAGAGAGAGAEEPGKEKKRRVIVPTLVTAAP